MAGMTHYIVPRVFLEQLSEFLGKLQDEAVQTPSAVIRQFEESANVLQFKVDVGILNAAEPPKVYLVIEDEPETNTDFPSVVIAAYWTQEAAEARVREERKDHGLEDDAAYADSDKTWTVESHEVEAPPSPSVPLTPPPQPVEEAEEGIDHAHFLDAVHEELDGREWNSETGDRIAQILRQAGYTIKDSGEADDA